jgi:hypothetical protein
LFCAQQTPNTPAIAYTTSTEAWKQAKFAKNRFPSVPAKTKENA